MNLKTQIKKAFKKACIALAPEQADYFSYTCYEPKYAFSDTLTCICGNAYILRVDLNSSNTDYTCITCYAGTDYGNTETARLILNTVVTELNSQLCTV